MWEAADFLSLYLNRERITLALEGLFLFPPFQQENNDDYSHAYYGPRGEEVDYP